MHYFSFSRIPRLTDPIRRLACMGALLTILAIGIDPTVQQTVVVRTRQVDARQRATVPRAQAFAQFTAYTSQPDSIRNSGFATMRLPTSALMGAIYSGLFFDSGQSSGPSRNIVPNCPTGSCTFPKFQSLGTCAVCKDIATPSIGRKCTRPAKKDSIYPYPSVYICEWSLPNGVRLNQSVDENDIDLSNNRKTMSMPIVANTNFPLTEAVGHGGVILNITILWGTRSDGPRASQCTISWCVNTYETRVDNGQLTENIVASWYTNKTFDDPIAEATLDWNLTPPAINASVKATNFTVHDWAARSLNGWMQSKFNFTNSMGSNQTDGAFNPDIVSSWRKGNEQYSPAYDIFRTNRNFSDIFQSVAKSLTTYIRSIDSSDTQMIEQEGEYIAPTRNPVVGQAWTTEVYIAVRWPWLAFSGTILVLSIVFFVLVVAQSAREDVPVWKSSPFALLFHGLSTEMVEQMRGVNEVREMELKARHIRVCLRDSGGGLMLEIDRGSE